MDRWMDGRRIATGFASALLLTLSGSVASGMGVLICRQDDGSSETAPHLCAALSGDHAFLISVLVAPALVGGLTLAPVRTRTFTLVAVALLAIQAGVFTVWALVAHGTISW